MNGNMLLVATVSSCLLGLSGAVPVKKMSAAFAGNFVITNLEATNHGPASSINNSISFDFGDQDTPQVGTTNCSAHWSPDLAPSTGSHACANSTFTMKILDGTYDGLDDFIIGLSHTYYDNSVGDPPYNVLSKSGNLTLTYPGTTNYVCGSDNTTCRSKENSTLIAVVTSAVA